MDAYDIAEARFIQIRANASAANGLNVQVGPVPAGKIWTILRAYATNDVAPAGGETQYYWFSIFDGTYVFPVTRPVSQQVENAVAQYFPLLTEGLEIRLFPGDYLRAYRDAATAGSTISVFASFIESDMPLYRYDEPQIVKRQARSLSSVRQVIGSAIGAGSRPITMPGGRGPGRREGT